MSSFPVLIIWDDVNTQLNALLSKNNGDSYYVYDYSWSYSGFLAAKDGVVVETPKTFLYNKFVGIDRAVKENRTNSLLYKDIDFEKTAELVKEMYLHRLSIILNVENSYFQEERDFIKSIIETQGNDIENLQIQYLEEFFPGWFSFSSIIKDGVFYQNPTREGNFGMTDNHRDSVEWRLFCDEIKQNLKPDDRLTIVEVYV